MLPLVHFPVKRFMYTIVFRNLNVCLMLVFEAVFKLIINEKNRLPV